MHIYIACIGLTRQIKLAELLEIWTKDGFSLFHLGGGFPVITCSIGGASRRLSRSDFANTNQELT